MPKYIYECLSCETVLEVRHGMTEKLEKCTKCDSKEITKRISDFTLEHKESTNDKKEIGTEVKKFIENTREEINEERESLSSRIIK